MASSNTDVCIAWLHSLSVGERVDLRPSRFSGNKWVPGSVICRDSIYSKRTITVMNETDGTSCEITLNPDDFQIVDGDSRKQEEVQKYIDSIEANVMRDMLHCDDSDSESDSDSGSESSLSAVEEPVEKEHVRLRKAYSMVPYHHPQADCWKDYEWDPEFRCTSCHRMCCQKCMGVFNKEVYPYFKKDQDPSLCKECFISIQNRNAFQITKWLFHSLFDGRSKSHIMDFMDDHITIIIAQYAMFFQCEKAAPQAAACDGFISFEHHPGAMKGAIKAIDICSDMVWGQSLICNLCWRYGKKKPLFGGRYGDHDSDDSSS